MPNVRTLNGEEEATELVSYEYAVYIDDTARQAVLMPDRKTAEAFIAAIERSQWGVPPLNKFHPSLVSRKVTTKRDLWVEL